jgi:peptide/nickel transport system substrate-binding protein
VALTTAAGSIWVANNLAGTVSRIDPSSLKVLATVAVGASPSALAAADGSVWVGSESSDSVSRIDPRRDVVSGRVVVGGPATSLTAVSGRVWVAVNGDLGTHRGGTLSILGTQRFASIDPALFYQTFSPQFIGLTYDTLVTFDHSGTGTGLNLVPDLARTLPVIADHGKTYTFRLRPGIRYSDGRYLQASDFRRAFERLFRIDSPGAPLFNVVRGAERCRLRPGACDLSAGVVTDDGSETVTFRLTAPDPDFLLQLTEDEFSAPIPAGTPDHAPLAHPPAGTGPYRVLAVTYRDIRLGRNPYFREWSHDAQPDGNPDVIDWRFVASAQDAVTAVRQGIADYFFGLIAPTQYRQLQIHAPAQVHSNPSFAVDFLPLNTRRPPFDDRRARQALNYAIDRRHIARLYGGPEFAAPTCQPLTPGLPGYRRFCPYTRDPSDDGIWRAPDLARAQRLVRASGTEGDRVDLWGTSDESYVPRGVAVYVAQVLRALGYRVHLHVVPYSSITEARRRHFQLSADGDWLADYPEPSAYLPQFFGCTGGDSNGYYCNPSLDRNMRAATADTATDPDRADRQWTAIDRRLTEAAAWVPTVNLREVDLVSARLHNYQYNPVWGFLVDQSWVGH